jgi:hypothetical protein
VRLSNGSTPGVACGRSRRRPRHARQAKPATNARRPITKRADSARETPVSRSRAGVRGGASGCAAIPDSTCVMESRGDYGFAIDGTILVGPPPVPSLLRGVAMTHFDGRGNLSQVDFVTRNGVPAAADWRPHEPVRSIRIVGTAGIVAVGAPRCSSVWSSSTRAGSAHHRPRQSHRQSGRQSELNRHYKPRCTTASPEIVGLEAPLRFKITGIRPSGCTALEP